MSWESWYMTLSEFEHKLKAMPPAEKAKLLKDLGNLEEDRCLETFATNPRWELKICRMLGVTPQSEKVGKAVRCCPVCEAWFLSGTRGDLDLVP